jgi:hypothetical protein
MATAGAAFAMVDRTSLSGASREHDAARAKQESASKHRRLVWDDRLAATTKFSATTSNCLLPMRQTEARGRLQPSLSEALGANCGRGRAADSRKMAPASTGAMFQVLSGFVAFEVGTTRVGG